VVALRKHYAGIVDVMGAASFAIRAQQRMGYGRCFMQVLEENWKAVETMTNEDVKPVVQR